MSEALLPAPPRHLHRQLRRELWFGHPLLLMGLSNIFLVSLLTLLLFLIYGLGLSSLRAKYQEAIRVNSLIHEVGDKALPSGGTVRMVSAQLKINQVIVTVYGYGPKTEFAKVGDPVEIVVPKTQTRHARLVGFHTHPVEAGKILWLVLLLAVPGLVLCPLSLVFSFRKQKLLQLGDEKLGRITKSIPLPRPLKDKELVRWEYDSSEGIKSFWCVQDKGTENRELLVYRKTAAALHNLLDKPMFEQGQLQSGALIGKYCLRLNLLSALGIALLVTLFLFT